MIREQEEEDLPFGNLLESADVSVSQRKTTTRAG